jgi:hypothetical protein
MVVTSMPKRSRQAGWRLDRGRVAVLRVGSLRSLPRRQRVAAVVAASTRPLFTYTRIYILVFLFVLVLFWLDWFPSLDTRLGSNRWTVFGV